LTNEKKRGYALDPVCNFHLKNGAQIEKLNWMCDVSPEKIAQSAGIMVNYRYIPYSIDENNHNYTTHGVIAASDEVTNWLAVSL